MFTVFTVAKLRRKPRHFHQFTGLTPAEFDRLREAFEPVYQQAQHEHHERPDRQRAIGAGHPLALSVPDRLLLDGVMNPR